MTFISNLEIIQLRELIWFPFESHNYGWHIAFWFACLGLSLHLTCPESTKKMPGLEWIRASSSNALCSRASASFSWTSPWKAPPASKGFESSHGRNISYQEIRPESEHCSTGFWKWSYRADVGAFALETVMLLIVQERSNYPPLERLFPGRVSSPMETCFRRWEEVPSLCYIPESLIYSVTGLNLLIPRTADQFFSLSDSSVSGGNICPVGYKV